MSGHSTLVLLCSNVSLSGHMLQYSAKKFYMWVEDECPIIVGQCQQNNPPTNPTNQYCVMKKRYLFLDRELNKIVIFSFSIDKPFERKIVNIFLPVNYNMFWVLIETVLLSTHISYVSVEK